MVFDEILGVKTLLWCDNDICTSDILIAYLNCPEIVFNAHLIIKKVNKYIINTNSTNKTPQQAIETNKKNVHFKKRRRIFRWHNEDENNLFMAYLRHDVEGVFVMETM